MPCPGTSATARFRSSPPTPEAAPRIDHFFLHQRIGSGGMGVVYAGYDPRLEPRVAIKILHGMHAGARRTEQELMLREARALARLQHPNVVTVHHVGEHEGQVYLAMDYVEATRCPKTSSITRLSCGRSTMRASKRDRARGLTTTSVWPAPTRSTLLCCCSRLRPQPPDFPSRVRRTALVSACLRVGLGAAAVPCDGPFSPEMARLSRLCFARHPGCSSRPTLAHQPRSPAARRTPPSRLFHTSFRLNAIGLARARPRR